MPEIVKMWFFSQKVDGQSGENTLLRPPVGAFAGLQYLLYSNTMPEMQTQERRPLAGCSPNRGTLCNSLLAKGFRRLYEYFSYENKPHIWYLGRSKPSTNWEKSPKCTV